jgi:hypothetical protein
LHPRPADAVIRLWRAGFDATQGASSLQVVQPPQDRPDLRACRAAAVMERILYLPVHRKIGVAAASRLVCAAARIWEPAEEVRRSPARELSLRVHM